MAFQLRRLLLVALLLGCYAYVLPRWSDWSQNSRLNLVLALVDDGTVSIDRYKANTGDYALYKGRAYSDKAPGPVFLALPVYQVLSPILNQPAVQAQLLRVASHPSFEPTLTAGGTGLSDEKLRFALVQYALTLLTVALPAALFGLVLLRALRRLGLAEVPALLCVLGYGLGTSAAPYAGNFYSHQLTAVLTFSAFWLVWQEPPARPWVRALLVGLLLGWAVISEYPAALAALAVGLYALSRQGSGWAAPIVVGGALPVALMVCYDLVAFGTLLPIGYAYSALWQDQHHTGFMSLTYPRPESLWGLLLGAFRGLFVRAPWLLLAIPGYVLWWRGGRLRAEWWVALAVPLSVYLFYASSEMWWGGFAAGPRYIVLMLPFLTLPAAWCVGVLWRRTAGRIAAGAMMILSVTLVWLEALAGQLFPPDSITATWSGYVLPAWAHGDVARNAGMVLGLDGPLSIVPLALAAAALTALLLMPGTRGSARPLDQRSRATSGLGAD